jgi:hypothetical protein
MKILENAKAYVSLVALIATALLGSFATDSLPGKILTAIVAVGGAFATWRVPNQPAA